MFRHGLVNQQQQQQQCVQQHLQHSSLLSRRRIVICSANRSQPGPASSAAAPQNRPKQQQQQQQQQQQRSAPGKKQSKPKNKKSSKSSTTPPRPRKPSSTAAAVQTAPDDLACVHFGACSGCTLQQGLWTPPVAAEARQFFDSRIAGGGDDDDNNHNSSSSSSSSFRLHTGPVHGWRCRAKLAVRGGDMLSVGLFVSGSHAVVDIIPDCRTHHPRINTAAQLVKQVAAGLRIQPYQEQQQQQQQQKGHRKSSKSSSSSSDGSDGSSSSSSSSGYLRYLQLTALPSKPGGRAEEDVQAQVQLVIVWAAPDASHPSFSEAKRLAAALWSQGGPVAVSPLALLRARAEAAAAAASNSGSSSSKAGSSKAGSSSSSSSSNSSSTAPGSSSSAVVVRRGLTGNRVGGGSAAALAGGSSSSNGEPSSLLPQQQQQQPLLHSIWVNFQPHPDSNRVLGETWQLMHGPETGWQQFGGVQLAIQPGSFVQANYGAMQRCLSSIAAAVPPGSSVLELYAGSGVIGLSLAAAAAAAVGGEAAAGDEAAGDKAAAAAATAVRRVVCVEINPLARQPFEVSLARLAATNKAAASVVTHITASAADADELQQALQQAYRCSNKTGSPPAQAAAAAGDTTTLLSEDALPEVLVVDPPRKGLDTAVLQMLATDRGGGGGAVLQSVQRLVYLSCGFDALKADVDVLLVSGRWRVVSAEAFLFFPGTDTIETLVVLDRV